MSEGNSPENSSALADALRKFLNVDNEVLRLIGRYGADAVKAAVARRTKPNKGRKPDNDGPDLAPHIQADAEDWLAGRDPISIRSNWSIAKAIADTKPAHKHPSTMKRIERKLKNAPYDRRWHMLVWAEREGHEGYPHFAYLRTLKELCEIGTEAFWLDRFNRAISDLATYQERVGAPPSKELSMKEIEDEARKPAIPPPYSTGGLFGLGGLLAPVPPSGD